MLVISISLILLSITITNFDHLVLTYMIDYIKSSLIIWYVIIWLFMFLNN
jgi:hypothetical protein